MPRESRMDDSRLLESSFINSIIGEGTSFRGEFDLNGLLRIDGDFCGTIRTTGRVLVGSNGRAECTIYAGTVVIGGVVQGNIFAAEKVVVLSTGMIIGNINTPRLIVEDGVVLNGTCTVEGVARDEPERQSSGEPVRSTVVRNARSEPGTASVPSPAG